MSTLVKICGLRSAEHALAAVEAGADLLGFIFAPGRRQVTPEHVAAIAAQVRQHPAGLGVLLVGVFVNETIERMVELVTLCQLDVVQWSGDEEIELLDQWPLDCMVFKALRQSGSDAEQRWIDLLPSAHLRLLVDGHAPGSYGGAGVLADWAGAAALARQHDIVLAGGLQPDNVANAIQLVRPWGVDVSTGVETDGVKDVAKIQAFVVAARAADQQQGMAG